jgi:hypothetical protein
MLGEWLEKSLEDRSYFDRQLERIASVEIDVDPNSGG